MSGLLDAWMDENVARLVDGWIGFGSQKTHRDILNLCGMSQKLTATMDILHVGNVIPNVQRGPVWW